MLRPSERKILDHEPVSQLRRRMKPGGYCLDVDKSVLSMDDKEPSISENNDSTFCDGSPSEGTWAKEEEEVIVVRDYSGSRGISECRT